MLIISPKQRNKRNERLLGFIRSFLPTHTKKLLKFVELCGGLGKDFCFNDSLTSKTDNILCGTGFQLVKYSLGSAFLNLIYSILIQKITNWSFNFVMKKSAVKNDCEFIITVKMENIIKFACRRWIFVWLCCNVLRFKYLRW